MKTITHTGYIALYPSGQPHLRTYGFQRFITEAMLITTTKEPLDKLIKKGFSVVECTRTFQIDPVEDRKQDGLAEAREVLAEMKEGRDK